MGTVIISKCCRAEVRETDVPEEVYFYTCEKCNKECDTEEVCEFCLGEGEYATDESDGEGHIQRGVGTQVCRACKPEPDYDDQGE